MNNNENIEERQDLMELGISNVNSLLNGLKTWLKCVRIGHEFNT